MSELWDKPGWILADIGAQKFLEQDAPRMGPRSKAASMPGGNSHSARNGHAQPAVEIGHVAELDQLGAMLGWDHRWRLQYSGGVTDRKQGGKFFESEHFRFSEYDSSMARSRNYACSILLRSTNKGPGRLMAPGSVMPVSAHRSGRVSRSTFRRHPRSGSTQVLVAGDRLDPSRLNQSRHLYLYYEHETGVEGGPKGPPTKPKPLKKAETQK
jgi:hypothetical protein